MKHNKWFEETFLTSLKNGQWLSEKQMNICRKYMVESRYYGGTFLLACGNVAYKAVVCSKKGYGKFYKEEYEYNVEEKVTDRFGNQYSAYIF